MASLKEVYDRFVTQPNVRDLCDDATLTFISSGTNIKGANEIVQYVLRSRNDVQITENVLAYHTAPTSLTVEVAAECKFKNGPSWIVPGVDGNMLDGMVTKLPLAKTIVFTGGKIRSVRVYWDQATVLKQLEIVGARGRGWPITDGSKQIDLVTKTVVSQPETKVESAVEEAKSVAPVKVEVPSVTVAAPEKPKSKPMSTPRRTYSITGDVEVEVKETPRLPRIGWQNNRQHFLLSEEGDVSLKEQSPVRLPRIGQAPRREFSFSNLAEAYKSQETQPKQPTHLEVDNEEPNPVKFTQPKPSRTTYDIFETKEETTKPKPVVPRILQHETIFHDADSTPREPVKPSIGGGTGGTRLEETIFVELEEDSKPFIAPKKTPRRDQQAHFSITDQSPQTPAPRTKHLNFQHFSIEGTPDPNEAEYRARALQRKEVNHFRPDTIPHFEFTDNPEDNDSEPKRENTEGMNKLLKGIGRNWMMGSDSPSVAAKDGQRNGLPKKGLAPHFSFGSSSPEKSDEEKENGRTAQSQTKRPHVPVKAEEKEWWET